MTDLKQEIQQKKPFSSLEEEVFLNLLRSSDCLHRAFQQKARAWGLTLTQYNVLRILRGAQPDGLACAAIGARMIASVPDITRLLARLKALKLIRQRRDRGDRRVVCTQISPAGLELLRAMDPTIEKAPAEMLGHMSRAEMKDLIRLLEQARSGDCDEPPKEKQKR
jgi:DNA-binding MarR family transcriptional regulator